MQPGDYLAYYNDTESRRWFVRVIKIYQPFNSRFWHAIVNSEEQYIKTGYAFSEFGLGSAIHLALRPVEPDEAHPALSIYSRQNPAVEEFLLPTPRKGAWNWGTLTELRAKGIL